MRKKISVLAVTVCMGVMVSGCGQKAEPIETTAVQEVVVESETEEITTEATETETQSQEGTKEETEAQEETKAQASGGYEDNFAVDGETSAAFGKQIKDAVAAKDLEALADLASYPLYVGFADGGVSAESREDFIALGADRIFTTEMVEGIGAADETGLNPSMAGFSLTKDGKPNIIFGVTDGKLTVKGLNY